MASKTLIEKIQDLVKKESRSTPTVTEDRLGPNLPRGFKLTLGADSSLEAVLNPEHYQKHPGMIETIEVTRYASFNLGNAIKYIWRAEWGPKDDPKADLEKAIWYIQDEIKRRDGE